MCSTIMDPTEGTFAGFIVSLSTCLLRISIFVWRIFPLLLWRIFSLLLWRIFSLLLWRILSSVLFREMVLTLSAALSSRTFSANGVLTDRSRLLALAGSRARGRARPASRVGLASLIDW